MARYSQARRDVCAGAFAWEERELQPLLRVAPLTDFHLLPPEDLPLVRSGVITARPVSVVLVRNEEAVFFSCATIRISLCTYDVRICTYIGVSIEDVANGSSSYSRSSPTVYVSDVS